MIKISPLHRNRALTLIELVIVLALIWILAALLLPLLIPRPSGPRFRSNCMGNLKQVGLAWLVWAHDHETGDFPFRTAVTNGGTMGSTDPLRNNAWWQYAFLSNELGSPRTLLCPADRNVGLPRRIATNWSATDTNGGFMATGFRSRATSYTIELDATWPPGHPAATEAGGCVLGTDRNILFDGRSDPCSSGINGTHMVRVKGKNGQKPPAAAPWTNAIHGLRGNVLGLDGSVQAKSTQELDALFDLNDDNGSIHFLVPR